MSYTNYHNVPLVLAVWLAANDGYDLKPRPEIVSATSLMKPTKSLVLGKRLALDDTIESVVDVSDLVASRLGTAVHTAAEVAWLYSRDTAMKELGYPQKVLDLIKINPDNPSNDPQFDIYLEQRTQKTVGKWIVSGKFDFVENGRVKDIKTTKTYNWIKGSNDKKYMIQGSIYRWLNPEIITDDYVDILMVFTDWSPFKAMADKEYPQANILVRTIKLMSIDETERWVKERLATLEANLEAHQDKMPRCTPEELWMDPPKFAYYKNKAATTRATRVFDTMADAQTAKSADAANPKVKTVGMVVERKSEPKYCKYCEARPICLQAEGYIADGRLKLG